MHLLAPLAARNGAHLGEVPQREVGERPARLPQLAELVCSYMYAVMLVYLCRYSYIYVIQ